LKSQLLHGITKDDRVYANDANPILVRHLEKNMAYGSNGNGRSQKKKHDVYEYVTLGVAIAGVIVLVMYTGLTYCLSETAVDTEHRQIRAYVNIEKIIVPPGFISDAEKSHIFIPAEWINGGGSETIDLFIKGGCNTAITFDFQHTIPWHAPINRWVLGPHSSIKFLTCVIDLNNIRAWKNAGTPVYIYGQAVYQDIFSTRHHITQYCVKMDSMRGDPANNNLTADVTGCAEHNCTDGGCDRYVNSDTFSETD
jgi:hypothetical protein